MSIDRKEIERIIDSFETEAEKSRETIRDCAKVQHYNSIPELRMVADAYDRCAAVVKQVLHG